jgi:hypothetical protein
MAHVDQDLRSLLLKTIEVQRRDSGGAGPPDLMLDKKYNARDLVKTARNATLPEITILLRASGIREEGLTLVRAGDITSGERLLRAARHIVSEAGLSKEALASSESYQYPAEAYLQYKKGEYDRAEALLFQSIVLCDVLHDEFDHQVEVRRIHLARNIVRVKTRAGDCEEALRMASLLVGYVEGDQAQWPLLQRPTERPPDPLLPEERWILMDQVLGEIARLVTRRRATSLQLVNGSAGWLFARRKCAAGFARVHAWLAARRASIEGDAAGFLTHGTAFFAEGRRYLRQASHELTQDLVEFCMEIAPEEVASIQGHESVPEPDRVQERS